MKFFFHELVHLLDLEPRFLTILESMGVEGLATFVEFKNNPRGVTNELKNIYDQRVGKFAKSKFLSTLDAKKQYPFLSLARFDYFCGLHMWLVIYFSKLKLNQMLNLFLLNENLSQYMNGQYEKVFYAWFWRFRRLTAEQFLKEYQQAAKKLGIESLF